MSTDSAYHACLEKLYSLRRFGIKLGLDKILAMLDGLGNPQDSFQCVHIAGTNGKGSIASGLAAILKEAGYVTGLYTSPHLISFNERIQINGCPITDSQVIESYEAVGEFQAGDREPTFFEYATAMALQQFAHHGVEWGIVETGMGGRLDATNVLNPALSIISNISLEHQSYLGRTIGEIAYEKAGIIKQNVPVVTGIKRPQAWEVLQKVARERQATLYRLGDSFRVRRKTDGTFTYYGMESVWREIHPGLPGRHQVDNTALILAACEVLAHQGLDISEAKIRNGLMKRSWPGRLEVVSQRPFVLLDGAHNLMAARNLARYLKEELGGRRLILVVGILDDKPAKAILSCLTEPCDTVILTAAQTGRAFAAQTLKKMMPSGAKQVHVVPNVADAFQKARSLAAPEDAICVAGSLYVVGEARALLCNN